MIEEAKILCEVELPGEYEPYIFSPGRKSYKGELTKEVNSWIREGYEPISIGGTSGGAGDIKNMMKMCVLMVRKVS